MIKIVLDTNVFMSGIFWSGYPGKILDAWHKNNIKIVVSPDIVDEYHRVGNILAKKYPGIDVAPFIDSLSLNIFLRVRLAYKLSFTDTENNMTKIYHINQSVIDGKILIKYRSKYKIYEHL